MKPGMAWTADFRHDRVRIAVDKYGVVTKTPGIAWMILYNLITFVNNLFYY